MSDEVDPLAPKHLGNVFQMMQGLQEQKSKGVTPRRMVPTAECRICGRLLNFELRASAPTFSKRTCKPCQRELDEGMVAVVEDVEPQNRHYCFVRMKQTRGFDGKIIKATTAQFEDALKRGGKLGQKPHVDPTAK